MSLKLILIFKASADGDQDETWCYLVGIIGWIKYIFFFSSRKEIIILDLEIVYKKTEVLKSYFHFHVKDGLNDFENATKGITILD